MIGYDKYFYITSYAMISTVSPPLSRPVVPLPLDADSVCKRLNLDIKSFTCNLSAWRASFEAVKSNSNT